MTRTVERLALASVLVLGGASSAAAQDAAGTGPVVVDTTPPPATSTTYASATTDEGDSDFAIEFQGRLSLLSAFETLGTVGNTIPVPVAPVTLGVRLLDQRLYVGVGATFQRWHAKSDGGGTAGNTSLFAVSPIVTYDILSRGAAHLYPLVMLHFGVSDLVADNDFIFGVNAGIGLRGDIGDVVSLGTEWGWGMLHGNAPNMGVDTKYNFHGFFGTVNVSARIGL